MKQSVSHKASLPGAHMPDAVRGFTLIELLVVISIIALLAGMMLPMYGIVRDSSMRSRTSFVVKKTEVALRLFKAEWGAYPYQATYPDMSSGQFPNQLYYRIGTTISNDDRTKVIADMNTAGAQYGYNCTVGSNSGRVVYTEATQPSTCTFTWDRIGTTYYNLFLNGTDMAVNNNYGAMWMLNQTAQEQARLAVVAGNVNVRGPLVCSSASAVAYNQTGVKLLTSPASGDNPGIAVDYLKGDIEKSLVKGQAILDAWHNPLIYISQVIPALQNGGGSAFGFRVPGTDSRFMGLGASGFDPTTGPGPALMGSRPMLLAGGRVRLSLKEAGDGLGPTPANATYFPDADVLGHSDIRYYAAPGYETEFELWSAGRDGRFSYMRDDRENKDNLSVLPYNRGLNVPGATP